MAFRLKIIKGIVITALAVITLLPAIEKIKAQETPERPAGVPAEATYDSDKNKWCWVITTQVTLPEDNKVVEDKKPRCIDGIEEKNSSSPQRPANLPSTAAYDAEHKVWFYDDGQYTDTGTFFW